MLTAENLNRLEWEASDDADAPEAVNKKMVRKLIHYYRNLSEAHRVLLNKPEAETVATDRERIEFIRRAAIACYARQTGNKSVSDSWGDAEILWNCKPEGL